MANYDSVDLDFTWDGDFSVGIDGDFADNKDDLIRSLENEIHTVMRSEFDDWEKHPNLGANLSEFRGEPNSRENGRRMEERIRSRLVAIRLVSDEDVDVRVVPVQIHQVLVMVAVRATSTPNNRLEAGQPVVVQFIYDSLEDSVFYLPPSELARNFSRA